MKTYWDLTEQERAALTGGEVEQFGDAELMVKGVLKVTAPTLETVPPTPEPDIEVFAVSCNHGRVDIAFATADQARTFLSLKPLVRSSHWTGRESIHYVDSADEDSWKISAEKANSKRLADLRKSEFVAAKDVKSGNEALTNEYDVALKAQQDALASMWSDWRDCCLKASRMQKIAETFESYTRTAEGDKNIAFKFLLRVFTNEQIVEAVEWGSVEIPNGFIRMGHTNRIDEIMASPEAIEMPAAPL